MSNVASAAKYRSPWEETVLSSEFERQKNGHITFWVSGNDLPGHAVSRMLRQEGFHVYGNAEQMFQHWEYDCWHLSPEKRRLVIFSNNTFHTDYRTYVRRAREEFGYAQLPASDIVPVRQMITDALLEELHFDHTILLHTQISGGLFGIARRCHSMRRETDANSVQRFPMSEWNPYGACIMAAPLVD